jgi:hypothetical protein
MAGGRPSYKEKAVIQLSRRSKTKCIAVGSALFTTPGLFAEQLVPTRVSKEGPIYPDRLPLDSRAPHIHFVFSKNGRRVLVTQAVIKGRSLNPQNRTFTSGRDEHLFNAVLVDWKQVSSSGRIEWNVDFNIVLGTTLDELRAESIQGGIGPSERQGRRTENENHGSRRRSRQ